MFTGLIEELGKIKFIDCSSHGSTLQIQCSKIINDISEGDSISINGICLTVSKKEKNALSFSVSPETTQRSCFDSWRSGDHVNLERALKASQRLAGHIVQGHVDCTTVLQKIEKSGRFWNLEFKIPDQFEKYLVEKGSIAIDGISLTIAGLNEASFNISIIPETYSNTNIQYYNIGSLVNVEIDILAKYIEKILRSQTYSNDSKLTVDKLKKMGF